MWEFDHKTAWATKCFPSFMNLSDAMKSLIRKAVIRMADVHQDGAKSLEFPDDAALRKAFDEANPDELMRAQHIVYCFGHWESRLLHNVYGSWKAPHYFTDCAGGYWKFRGIAKQYCIEKGYHKKDGRGDWKTVPELRAESMKPYYYKHKEGTPVEGEELTYKYRGLLPGWLTAVDNISVNHRVDGQCTGGHPFMIGIGHFTDSMYLDPNAHVCYYPGCGMPYSAHHCDHALLVKITQEGVKKSDLRNLVLHLEKEMKADNLTGFAISRDSATLCDDMKRD